MKDRKGSSKERFGQKRRKYRKCLNKERMKNRKGLIRKGGSIGKV